VSTERPPDDSEDYMSWLERMWDVQKFDIPGRTEREEARTEEVLNIFKGLGELAKRHVQPPTPPGWETGGERSCISDDEHEQERCELEAAGWKCLERTDGQEVWLEPEEGLMYLRAAAVAIVRKGKDQYVPMFLGGSMSEKLEPGFQEVLEALKRALEDNRQLQEFSQEEVARQLVLGGYLQEEPSLTQLVDALATLQAEQQAFGPDMRPEDEV
jgi:hypothetical protein